MDPTANQKVAPSSFRLLRSFSPERNQKQESQILKFPNLHRDP